MRTTDVDGPRIASASRRSIYLVLGLGFGVGTVLTLSHLGRHGELPMTPWGFRSLTGGPFEQLDPERFAILGWSLVAVSAFDVRLACGSGRDAAEASVEDRALVRHLHVNGVDLEYAEPDRLGVVATRVEQRSRAL